MNDQRSFLGGCVFDQLRIIFHIRFIGENPQGSASSEDEENPDFKAFEKSHASEWP
jgi:hypothetical protein